MDLVKLGNRIRNYRNKIGMSQEDFSLMIGMDRTYYSSVENGKYNITINNLEKIANGLNITLSELLKEI